MKPIRILTDGLVTTSPYSTIKHWMHFVGASDYRQLNAVASTLIPFNFTNVMKVEHTVKV